MFQNGHLGTALFSWPVGKKICFLERFLKVSEFGLNNLDWFVLGYVPTLKESLWPLQLGVWGRPAPRARLGVWVKVRKGRPVVTLAGAPHVVRKTAAPCAVRRGVSVLEEARWARSLDKRGGSQMERNGGIQGPPGDTKHMPSTDR